MVLEEFPTNWPAVFEDSDVSSIGLPRASGVSVVCIKAITVRVAVVT